MNIAQALASALLLSQLLIAPPALADPELLNEQVVQLYRQGHYREALALAQQSLHEAKQQYGLDHAKTAASLNNLAGLYESMGRYEDALLLYRRALAINEKTLGPDHATTAASLNNLAYLYKAMGRYEDTLPLYRRALAINEKALGADHATTAISLNNLALLFKAMGRYEDALSLYRRALAIREKALGEDHPDTAASLNNLAGLYESMGRYEDALLLYRRALAINEKALGADHATTASGLNNFAVLYKAMGRYEDALPLFRRALAIKEKVLGADHATTASGLNNLAALYESMGRYEDALPLYRRALAIKVRALGPNHDSTATSLDNLAGLYESMGRYEDALPLYRRALAIKEKALGPDHATTAVSLNNLAALYESMGRYEEALPLYRRALRIVFVPHIDDLSREHGAIEYLAKASANLASFLAQHGGADSRDEAIYYYKLSVNTRQRMRAGTKKMDQAVRDSFTKTLEEPYQRLAQLLIQQGRLAEAERVLFLLKESELNEFLRRSGSEGTALPQLVWTTAEQEYHDALVAQVALWREVEQQRQELLARQQRQEIQADGPEWRDWEERRASVEKHIETELNHERMRFNEASHLAQEARLEKFTQARTQLADKLGEIASRDATPTAGLILLPGDRGLSLVYTTPQGAVPMLLPVEKDTLSEWVSELRRRLQDRQDYQSVAQALYQQLIKPVQAQLEVQGIQQLVLLPIGPLRDLPFAALMDEQGKHLLERLALVQLSADGQNGALAGLAQETAARWQGAAMGAAQGTAEQPALPNVTREVCGIIRAPAAGACQETKGLIGGERYLDGDFKADLLRLYLGNNRTPANFLHIASHYQVDKGLLLLGDGDQLTPKTLKQWNPKLGRYDLVTLSACSSGLDAGAVESLGGLFRSLGAKAVMATLWPVADVGAAPLMLEFYRQRGEQRQQSKAQALRQAQLAMLRGELKGDKHQDLRHPYFWAPYVLMGNWL